MHIPRINVLSMHRKLSVKSLAAETKSAHKKVIKKLVPAAMIITESLGSLNAHAPIRIKPDNIPLHLSKIGVANWFDTDPFDGRTLYIKPAVKNLLPKNHFNKNSACLRETYKGTAEDLNYFIDKLIPKRNGTKEYNPFYKKGEAFIKFGQQYNVNPTVLIAIGMHESGRGTSKAAREMKNIGGIYLNNKRAKFDNVEDCIEIMAQTINTRIKANNKSIADVGNSGKYCAKTSSEEWINNVMFFLNKM